MILVYWDVMLGHWVSGFHWFEGMGHPWLSGFHCFEGMGHPHLQVLKAW
jgi:hypothetical protein